MILLMLACKGSPADTTSLAEPTATAGPLTEAPYTTLQAAWQPLVPPAETVAAIEAGELRVTDLERFEEAGLGVVLVDGHPWLEDDTLAPGFTNGGDRRSLLYIWQAADPQLIDEESPIRFEAFEAIYRPQGHLTTQVFDAHVATARRISEASGRPIDFAVIAGDLTDGGQENELGWFITTMAGGTIDPDSGADDDPVAGPGNDHSDLILAGGIGAPWYAALGNHETLYNGGFGNIDEELRAAAVGEEVYDSDLFANGFRDGATVTGEVVDSGSTPPDAGRAPLYLEEALGMLHDAPGEPEGHGISPELERGYFSVHPIPDRPVRLVVLQTVEPDAPIGLSAQGHVSEAQLTWLQSELAEADAEHELVVVMSHHRPEDFATSSEVSGEQIAAALAGSEGVVVAISGHGHFNDSDRVGADDSAEGGYWQLMLSSTVDYPMQSRMIEIVDERNGSLSIYTTNLGHNSPPDSLAHRGRALSAAAMSFGGFHSDDDVLDYWEGDVEDQNLLLRVQISAALQDSLGRHDWPTRIESEQTLAGFTAP